MFTGIIEALGTVARVEEAGGSARLAITAPAGFLDGVTAGASVAVNGVCLTATSLTAAGGVTEPARQDGAGSRDGFLADVMGETLKRTALAALRPGDPVNLERPVPVTGRLDGHIVQGHVDGVATVISRTRHPHWEVLRVSLPAGLARYLAEKGSVAVDGVSLTVSATGPDWFEVSLIPETLHRTVLGGREPGDQVNLEADVIAKYTERLVRQ